MKRAQTIPWLEIEKKYAKLFSNKKSNVAKSLNLGFGASIIQTEYGYSNAEILLQIEESNIFSISADIKQLMIPTLHLILR